MSEFSINYFVFQFLLVLKQISSSIDYPINRKAIGNHFDYWLMVSVNCQAKMHTILCFSNASIFSLYNIINWISLRFGLLVGRFDDVTW